MRASELHKAESVGKGEKTFVLAYGIGGNKEQMAPLAALLSESATVWTFDIAGFGDYDMSEYSVLAHSSLYGYADDLVSLMDDLQISGATYVGHSLSGMSGILASLGRPELFTRLVTIGASARYLDDPAAGYVGGMVQSELDSLFDMIERDYAAWAAGFAQAMMMSDPESAAVTSFTESLAGSKPEITIAALRAAFSSDFRREVTLLAAPTLVLNSSQDLAVPEASAAWLAANIPSSGHNILDVPGHFPHVLAPELIAKLILDFEG